MSKRKRKKEEKAVGGEGEELEKTRPGTKKREMGNGR